MYGNFCYNIIYFENINFDNFGNFCFFCEVGKLKCVWFVDDIGYNLEIKLIFC